MKETIKEIELMIKSVNKAFKLESLRNKKAKRKYNAISFILLISYLSTIIYLIK